MVVLPLALTYMLGFKYTVPLIGSIVLFMIIVVFSWIFSIGLWANQNLPQDQSANRRADRERLDPRFDPGHRGHSAQRTAPWHPAPDHRVGNSH